MPRVRAGISPGHLAQYFSGASLQTTGPRQTVWLPALGQTPQGLSIEDDTASLDARKDIPCLQRLRVSSADALASERSGSKEFGGNAILRKAKGRGKPDLWDGVLRPLSDYESDAQTPPSTFSINQTPNSTTLLSINVRPCLRRNWHTTGTN